MPAKLKTCVECGTEYYARADSMYCSVQCKQRAWRRLRRSVSSTDKRDKTGIVSGYERCLLPGMLGWDRKTHVR